MKDGFPVSIAELLAAGEPPLPSEAVAIVLDVCAQVLRRPASASVLPAISAASVFVDASGSVAIGGGVPVEDDQTVLLLGRMLLQMLPTSGSASAARVPARLRLLASRAATGDAPRLSVGRFAAALRRFGPEQSSAAIRHLFERWRSGLAERDEGRFGREAVPAQKLERRSSLGPDVFRRLLREADHDRYLASARDGAPAEEGDDQGSAARPAAPDRARRRRRSRIAIVVVALLLVVGAGAAYWLSADEQLPPLPITPPHLSIQPPPPPPRTGWELLAPSVPLAADEDGRGGTSPTAGSGTTTGRDRHEPADGRGKSQAGPEGTTTLRGDHHP